MNQELTTLRIDSLRSSARHVVRELGFMHRGLAGTELSPSAVHAIIELGHGTVTNASDLGALLHLEKSSISRLVQTLQKASLIAVAPDPKDMRSRVLSLTPAGDSLLVKIETYARRQLLSALNDLCESDICQIETGLTMFAKALRPSGQSVADKIACGDLQEGYRAGIIGAVARLHASFYAQNYGFGAVFERKVATEMSEFMGRIDRPMNTVFSAYDGDELLGSVSIDGEDLEKGESHLRWFIVSSRARGMGIGRLLIDKATLFVDQQAFNKTRLWTFQGLDAARNLYEKQGFVLVHETPGTQWGTEVVEQEFARERGA